MCNNNCCMCCNCNTHDEDTPQEVTYTSVCDSDVCKQNRRCCCDCMGPCENDPSLQVLGLSEKMEECCEQMHEALEQINCELENLDDKIQDEIERSTGEDEKHNDQIEDLYDRESIDVNNIVYIDTPGSEVIEFWHIFPEEDEKDPVKIGEVDAKPFIKDGILDRVELESDGHTLHFVWNTDAGKQDSHVDLDRLVQPIALELNQFKTTVANTYETKVAAGNHITNVEYGQNDNHTLVFTKENGQTITRTIPDNDLYIQSGEYTGGNLVLRRNNNTTVTIPVPATNHIVGGSISGDVITLTRENGGTPVTIQLPEDDNNYVTSGEVVNNVLKLSRRGLSGTVDIPLPNVAGQDTYPVSGSVANNTLTLTMNNGDTVDVQLPAWITSYTDTNYYPTQGSVNNNDVLTLSSSTNGFPTMTVQLPNYSRTDNDHYVTGATVDSNNILTLTGNSGFTPVSVQLPTSGGTGVDTNYYPTQGVLNGSTITISGNSGFTPFTIDLSALVNRITALEGLWKKTANNDGLEPVTANHKVYGYGFYDTAVS